MKHNKQGSILSVVILSTVVGGMMAATIVSLLNNQRNMNARKELQLQANNAAEAAADYAFSYIVNEIDAKSLALATSVPSSGSSTWTMPSAATTFLSGTGAVPGGATSAGSISISTPVIKVLAPSSPVRYFMDPNDPAQSADPNINQWILETNIPIIASVTATVGGRSYTAYVEKDISLREVPLFQHAVFFANQLFLHRGYRPLGSIHSNGPMFVNAHDSDTAKYTGFISTASGFYRGSPIDVGGAGGNGYGYVPVTASGDADFSASSGLAPVATGNTSITIFTENDGSTDLYKYLSKTFDSRLSNWKDLATETFKGHLKDKSHETPALVPTGSDNYMLDVGSTFSTNEFTNGPYSLIEPVLPSTHPARKPNESYKNNLEANASLVLRVEFDPARLSSLVDKTSGAPITSLSDVDQARNISEALVVKGYKYAAGWTPGSAGSPTLVPVTLPVKAVGTANSTITAIDTSASKTLRPEPYVATQVAGSTGTWRDYDISSGLHDPRLGRPVEPITIDMAELKRVMEADPTSGSLSTDEAAFRTDFKIKHPSGSVTDPDWNGVVYVEFPTSLNVDSTQVNTKNGITTYAFDYGSAELRHPDRASESDSRPNRSDEIVPIAPELRRYPSSVSRTTITSPEFAIPAVQIINAKQLPDPSGSPGFTLATNGPIYLVGSYNSDGNYTTGTNITSTAADAWAEADTDEVPAALFSDSLTILSDSWAGLGGNRGRSYNGNSGGAYTRPVPLLGNNRIEIGASIATGEFPIFEFFTRAAENFKTIYDTGINPIIFKGSMVGMFHSEIQHIKTAYGRLESNDIQVYWNSHGAFAIPTVRYHKFLVDGHFPPGTPMARVPAQANFRLLRPGDPDDAVILAAAGF